eukprot:TRINITY_DN7392_c0_g1_i1.p1 TRINITY_DN7392_c0_g1~~TRINITY_DN7392_c0_g1_i1.p1  ORF type:complete len:230 (+),score=51.91 TRINITY_DN7392_c0_g1_i1:3-692(+)
MLEDFFYPENAANNANVEEEEEWRIKENIKIGYIYTSNDRPGQTFKQNPNFKIYNYLNVLNHAHDTNKEKILEELNGKHFDLVFLDGGNCYSVDGAGKEIGDNLARYVEEGGKVCTLGYTNVHNSDYAPKGRWNDERLQVVQGTLSAYDNFYWRNYSDSIYLKGIESEQSIKTRKVGNKETSLCNDAEVLLGNKEYPVIARRKFGEGYVYCINSDSENMPLILLRNFIK